MKLLTLLAVLPAIHGKAINKNVVRDIKVGGIGLDTVLGATGSVDLGLPVSVNIALPPVASQGLAILTGTASGDFDVVLHAFSSISIAMQNLVKITGDILLQLNVNTRTMKRQNPAADLNAAFTAAINAIDGGTDSLNGIGGSLSLTQAAALVADQVAVQTAVTAFVGILITNQGIFVQACLGADIKAQAGSLLTATANLEAALNAKLGLIDLSSLGLNYQPALDLIQSLVRAYAGQDVLPAACGISSTSIISTSSSAAAISSSSVASTSMSLSTGSSTVVSSTSTGTPSSSITGQSSSSSGTASSSTTGKSSSSTDTSSSNTASTWSSMKTTSSVPGSSSSSLTASTTTPDVPSSSTPVSSAKSLASSSIAPTSNLPPVGASSVSSSILAPSDMPQAGPSDSNASSGPSDENEGNPMNGNNMNGNAGDNAVSGSTSGACTCVQGGVGGSGLSNAQPETGSTPTRSAGTTVASSTSVKYTGAASIARMDATLGIVAGLAILIAL